MKKLNMYTIYNVVKDDLDKELNKVDLCDREINLQSNNLIRKYLRFKGLDENKDLFLEGIVKVLIPKFESIDDVVNFLTEPINFNDKKYIPLISSPSMMKREDDKEDYKTEYLYIDETEKDFINVFESITSLGKIQEKRNSKDEVAINKDIIARLSLSTSASHLINYKPKIVVLDAPTYNYTAKYRFFNNGDYNKLDIKEFTNEFEAFDGDGLMSPHLANIIREDMGVNYPVDFAVVRLDQGLCIKGLLVKVDFNSYFSRMYKSDITGIFEKRKDGFYTKDYFGNMVNLSKADMIVNTNMAKWSKWWGKEGWNGINKEFAKEEYSKYLDLISNLCVTKINKKEPRGYTLTNYQLICNLALVLKELEELSKETYDMYNRVLDFDIDAIRFMLGDIATESEELKAMDKIHYLLQSTDEALKIPTIKKQLIKMVKKKITELAEGRFYVKGNYKIACSCPITMMDWIMTRDLDGCNAGLKANEFYVPQEKGNRIMSRNPLNSFSEISKFTIVENELIEEYCGKLTPEIIIFNRKDDRLMLNSGEDTDGDFNFIVDNEIMYNAVIEPKDGINFINVQDNKDTIKHELKKENEYYCIAKASGNLIGSIANIGIKICVSSTELGYRGKSGKTYGYSYIKEEFEKKYKSPYENSIESKKSEINTLDYWVDKSKDEAEEFELSCKIQVLGEELYDLRKLEKANFKVDLQEFIDKALEVGTLVQVDTLSEVEQKEIIIKQFYERMHQSYLALELQMLSIDVPKTLKEVDKDLIKSLNKSISEKYEPIFKKYSTPWEERKDKNDRDKIYSRTHSILNLFAMNIASDLLKKYKEINEEITELCKSDRVGCIHNILSKAIETDNTKVVALKIGEIFIEWRNEHKDIRLNYGDNKKLRNEMLNRSDLTASKKIMALEYDINTLGSALLKVSKTNKSSKRTEFAMSCCFNIMQGLLDVHYVDVTKFILNENGEYHYKFKNYDKVKTPREKQNMQQNEILNTSIKLGETIVIKYRKSEQEGLILSKTEEGYLINEQKIFNNKVKGIMTYDALDKIDISKAIIKNVEMKPTYTIAYVEV